ncbi:MAG TPA: flagellar basal body-associated FliL family protein [Candidatus Binatia bacterium]|jgi:flagellar FliL protein|nr:flagellar basal body-associated FliL family protein [Candidatus Binatia bacterium]
MAEESAPEGAAAEEKPAGGGRKLVLIAVAVLLLGGGGGAAWYLGLFGGGKSHPPAEGGEAAHGEEAEGGGEHGTAEAAIPDVGALAPLDPFIANLSDEDGRRYLKATLQVEFFKGQVPGEWSARLPQVRDLLLTLFSSKNFAEVRTPQGKAVLRDEIVTRLNHALRQDMVKAVYFTEFIVQ